MVGTDTGGHSEFEVLSFGEAFGGEVARVEGSCDDDFGVDKVLIEGGVFALLVGGGYELMALILKPLAEAELVFGCAEEAWDVAGVGAAIVEDCKNFDLSKYQ